MKFKSILKFIIISIVIICLYISFSLNIENFTISYNNKKQEHKNTYYKSDNGSDILSKIGYAINDYYSKPTQSNIDVIKYSKIIRKIIKKYSGIKDNKINEYINEMKEMDRIRLINNELLYIKEYEYELIFSLDVNNIEYRASEVGNNATIYDADIYIEAEKSRNVNKNEIYEKVRKQLEELGIVEKFGFEPETLYVKYFYAKGENQEKYEGNQEQYEGVYVIEDNKNHIRVDIELPTYEIKYLQINFEDYKTRA